MKERAASVLLGVAVTAVVLWFLLTPEIVADLRAVAAVANWWMLALAVLIGAAVQWLRAWRFQMMTQGALALPDAPLVRIAFQLNFLNFVLPFRLGELGFPVLLRRTYQTPLIRGAGILVLVRLFDLCTVGAILSGTAAALGLGTRPGISAVLWVAAVALALAPIGLVLGVRAATPLLHRALGRLAPSAEDAARSSSMTVEMAAILVSFAIWLVFGAIAAVTAAAAGDATSPLVALLGASAGNLAFALPINGIGGLGPSQAAWVAAVTRAGVPWNEAVIGALALYAVTLVSALLFGGIAMLAGRSGGTAERERRPEP
jgi:uncharacterized membrane protein YbhN (UPF0104 family)